MQKPSMINAQKLIGTRAVIPTTIMSNDKDALIYATGIGFSQDPMKVQDYKYTNEFNKQFAPFPTMGVVIPNADYLTPLISSPYVPQFNPFLILHAEERFTMIKKKLQIGVQYQHDGKIIDCMDKGKNAFILYRTDSYCRNKNGDKQLAFSTERLIFIRGLGGFKYQGSGQIKPLIDIPQRKPDYKFAGQTYPSQALIYRLSGDANPLHVDPSVAAGQNFQRPILHGLATYGVIAKVIVQNVLKNQPTRFKSIRGRFMGHVYPGEIVDISVWRHGENIYVFEAEVRNRKTKAVIGHVQSRESSNL